MWNEGPSSGNKSWSAPEGDPGPNTPFEILSTQDCGPHDDFIIKIRVKKPSNISYNTLNVTLEFGNSDDNTEDAASKSSRAIALDKPVPSTSRSTDGGSSFSQDTLTGSRASSFDNPVPSTSKTTGSGGSDPFWQTASSITNLTARKSRNSVRSNSKNDFSNLFQGLEKYLPQNIQEQMKLDKSEGPSSSDVSNSLSSKSRSSNITNKLSTITLTEKERLHLNQIFGPSKASEELFKSLDKIRIEQMHRNPNKSPLFSRDSGTTSGYGSSQSLYSENVNQSTKYIKPGKRERPTYVIADDTPVRGKATQVVPFPSNSQSSKVRTVKKDPKLFMKNRIVKSDIEKLLFSKAPDFAEKSRELPQMLERLAARQKDLEKRSSLRRRLLLDTNINIPENKNFLNF